MKKLFLFLTFILCVNLMWGETATFGSDWNSLYGTSYNGTFNPKANELKLNGTANNVTIAVTNGTSTNAYVKTSDFRAYNGYTIVLTAPDGNNITNVASTKGGKTFSSGISANVGNLSISSNAISWNGSTQSLTLSISGTVSFATITVTYSSSTQPQKTAQTLSFGETTVFDVNLGETFTAPTLTGANTTVTYESSNTGVATVASNGAVTIIGEGTTTITATAAEDETYSSATISYTINVTDPSILSISYIFNTDEGLSILGITKPNTGAGTDLGDKSYVVNPITMTATDASNHTRVWNNAGSTDLRVYKDGGTLTFTSNANITAIILSGSAVNCFTVNNNNLEAGNKWTGSAKSVTLKATGTAKISTIEVFYKIPEDEVTTPTLTPGTKEFAGSLEVSMETLTAGATIYYTTDGTEPTSASTQYTAAITITETTTVKAIAIKNGISSDVASETYTSIPVYANLAALVDAGTPQGKTVQVTLTNEVITRFYTSSSSDKRNGVYLMVGEQEIEIYCKDVPETWVVNGTISGTLTCTWKNFNGTWELCPDNWDDLTYTEPTATLASIAISNYKTQFYVNDEFEFGGQVMASYVEEYMEDADVTNNATFSGYDMSTAGTQTVTVSYTKGEITKEAEYEITVSQFVGSIYEKVTSAPEDWSGEYLIVYEAAGRVFNGLDGANDYVEATIENNKIISSRDMAKIAIAEMNGGYSLQIIGGDNDGKYISGKSGSNSIVYGDEPVANEITIEDGQVTILSNETSLRYNAASGNDRFRYYKTTTTGASYILPTLYKFVAPEIQLLNEAGTANAGWINLGTYKYIEENEFYSGTKTYTLKLENYSGSYTLRCDEIIHEQYGEWVKGISVDENNKLVIEYQIPKYAQGKLIGSLFVVALDSDEKEIVGTSFKVNAEINEAGATTSLDNATISENVQKVMRDGQILIIRDGITYSVDGRIVE